MWIIHTFHPIVLYMWYASELVMVKGKRCVVETKTEDVE